MPHAKNKERTNKFIMVCCFVFMYHVLMISYIYGFMSFLFKYIFFIIYIYI